MTVQIIIGGEDGAQAAMEMIKFIATINQFKSAETITTEAQDAPAPVKEEVPAPVQAKPEPAEPEAANDDVASRRKSRPKKKEEPTPEIEPMAEIAPEPKPEPKPAPAAEAPAFAPPPGINDVLSETESAPAEVQAQAKRMRDDLTPKAGEAPSANYCRATLLYLATVKGMDAGRKIFEKMGVQGIKTLPPEKFSAFLAEAEKALSV